MSATAKDRIKATFDRAVRAVFGSRLDYFGFYRAKVVSQSADGKTVDLQPEDDRIPGMQRVAIRSGIPGTVVKVAPGSFLRLGWDGGNPKKPSASLWDGGETVTSIEITATDIKVSGTTVTLANGELAVARQTDALSGTAGPYPINGVISGGNPNVKA